MAVCKFYLNGNCKFGDRCKYEHPNQSNEASRRNPFAPLSNSNAFNNVTSRESRGPSSGATPAQALFGVTKEGVKTDLSTERPQWPLSAYAPGLKAPKQLFGGDVRELSFEEVRLRHYFLRAQGQESQAVQEYEALLANVSTQEKTALNDLDGAVSYVVNGTDEHPNRTDICENLLRQGGAPQVATYAGNNSPAINPFSPRTPQAEPASQTPGPASVFGLPSKPSSTFPPVSHSNGVFGQPSSVQTSSAFGQPSNSPFAVNSAQISCTSSNNVTQLATAPINPFAVKSAFGASSGGPQPAGGAHGAVANPFAKPSAGNNAFQTNTTQQPGQGFPTVTNSTSSNMPGSVASIKKDSYGRLQTWNRRAVVYDKDVPCYRDRNHLLRRIWCPDGPPASTNFQEPNDEEYNEGDMHVYEIAREKGEFVNHHMPLVAPKRAWCNWNI